MTLHDPAHTGQADPAAGELLGGMQSLERLEQPLRVGRVEAGTVVADEAADLGIGDPEGAELDDGLGLS